MDGLVQNMESAGVSESTDGGVMRIGYRIMKRKGIVGSTSGSNMSHKLRGCFSLTSISHIERKSRGTRLRSIECMSKGSAVTKSYIERQVESKRTYPKVKIF